MIVPRRDKLWLVEVALRTTGYLTVATRIHSLRWMSIDIFSACFALSFSDMRTLHSPSQPAPITILDTYHIRIAR